jgi:Ca2+-binding RTX toxin-like protein
LVGSTGRNVMIGGTGADMLTGGSGDDLLVAGRTDYDDATPANIAALMSILNEWARPDLPVETSYASRVAHVRGTTPPPMSPPALNTDLLYSHLAPGGTVHNDTDKDTLIGGDGRDWFFAQEAATPTKDLLPGRTTTGALTEILDEI